MGACFSSLSTKSPFLDESSNGKPSVRDSSPPCPGSCQPTGGTPGTIQSWATPKEEKGSLKWQVPDFTREETEQTRVVTFSTLLRASVSDLGEKKSIPSAGAVRCWTPRTKGRGCGLLSWSFHA